MWSSMIGRVSEKPDDQAPSSSRRKDDDKRSKRDPPESVGNTSKQLRGDDRDRGFNPNSTSYSSTSRSPYPGTAAPSVASSYATASSKRPDERILPPDLVRNSSLAEQIPKSRSDREDRDRGADRESKHRRRKERSGSRDRKKDRKDRSRSRDKDERRRDKEERREKRRVKEGEKDRGITTGTGDDPGRTRAGEIETFNTQVGGAGFTQFPGQYDGGFSGMGPPPTQLQSMSDHVPDQFPGQFPIESTAPYRPPLAANEGGPGLAADYYGDAGESVADQPGVRPHAPALIVGAEPHLMAASPTAAPPPEPSALGGVGAAASFFSGASFQSPSTSPKPSGQSGSQRPLTTYQTVDPVNNPTYPPASGGAPTNTYQPSSVLPSNVYHSASAPIIPTLGSVAAGAAAGYMMGSHSSTHYEQTVNESANIHTSGGGRVDYQSPNYQPPPPQIEPLQQSYSSSGQPPRPGKSTSQSSDIPLYAAGAIGAAGLAAAAYHHNHHEDTQNSYSSRPHAPASSLAHPSHIGQQHSPTSMTQKHRHGGPVSGLIDFFRDPYEVARFEAYCEYVGICKYCFAEGSSPREAPRKHYYNRRRRSNEKLGASIRVDKDTRYGSDGENRRRKNKSWLATGIAGYGLGKVGETLFNSNNNFRDDTYSIKTGNHNESTTSLHHRRSSRSPDRASFNSYGVVGRSGDKEDVYISRRTRSRSRERKSGLAEAAIGAAVGASVLAAGSRQRSRSPKKPFVRERDHSADRRYAIELKKFEARESARRSRHSPTSEYVEARKQSTQPELGFFGGFFTSPPPREKRRATHKKKEKKGKKGFFSFGNSSSSSTDAAMAFGESDRSQRRKSGKAKKNDIDINATLLGISAAAAVLSANEAGNREKSKRKADLVAVKEVKKKPDRSAEWRHDGEKRYSSSRREDDEWEDDEEEEGYWNVDPALAYGVRRRGSHESMRSDSSGTSKWDWRWGGEKKQRKSERRTGSPPSIVPGIAAGLAGAAVGAALASHNKPYNVAMSDPNSLPPMQHVYPSATTDPYDYDVVPANRPIMTSRPSDVQIQHPQPQIPISSAVYSTQAPYNISYSAPTGPPVFSQRDPVQFSTQPAPYATDYAQQGASGDPSQAAGTKEYAVRPVNFENSRTSMDDRQLHRRDSAPVTQDASTEFAPPKRSATAREESSATRFHTKNGTESVKSQDERKEPKKSIYKKPDKQGRKVEIEVESEGRKSKEERSKREQEIDREIELRKKELQQQRRDSPSKPESKSSDSKGDASRNKETNSDNSWTDPALAGIAGAIVGAVIAGKEGKKEKEGTKEERRERRREERRRREEDERIAEAERNKKQSPPDDEVRREREREIAGKVAEKLVQGASPVHEDYSTFFAPADVTSKSDEHEFRDPGANADNDITVYNAPHIITIEPGGSRSDPIPSPVPYAFPTYEENIDLNRGRMQIPWQVPALRLILPTPPGSRSGSTAGSRTGSVKGDASPDMGPHDAPTAVHELAEVASKSPIRSKVTFGEDEIREYEVITPLDHREDFIESPDSKRDTEFDNAKGKKVKNKDIKVQSDRSRPSEEDSPIEEITREHMPGEFEDDYDFAAVLAAGAALSGFNPDIVINDPSIRRRDSPPRSESSPPRAIPSGIHQVPLNRTIESLHESDSSGVAPPKREFVEQGNIPSTPKTEAEPVIPGSFEVETETNRSKRDIQQKVEEDRRVKDSDSSGGISTPPSNGEIPHKLEAQYHEPHVIEIVPKAFIGRSDRSVGRGVEEGRSVDRKVETTYHVDAAPAQIITSRTHPLDQPAFSTLASENSHSRNLLEDASDVPLPDDDDEDVLSSTIKEQNSKGRTSCKDHTRYEEPEDDRISVAATAPLPDDFDEPRKTKKKSKRKSTGSNDTASVASLPAKFDDGKSNGKTKQQKKGGLFSIFGKTATNLDDSKTSKDEVRETSIDDFEEMKKSKKSKDKDRRRSRDADDYDRRSEAETEVSRYEDQVKDEKPRKPRSRDVDEPYGRRSEATPEASRAEDDGLDEKSKKSRRKSRDKDDFNNRRSEAVSEGSRIEDSWQEEKPRKSRKFRDKDERGESNEESQANGNSGRITQDLPAKSRDLTNTRTDVAPGDRVGEDAELRDPLNHKQEQPPSFLGMRQEIAEPPDVDDLPPKRISSAEALAAELAMYEEVSSRIAREYHPPLPDSRPTTPTAVGSTDDLPPLPISQPTSPTATPSDRRRPISMLQLSEPSFPTTPTTRLFWRPPSSAGLSRSSPSTPIALREATVTNSPSQRKGRPLSGDMRSTEFRPLWLLERHNSIRRDQPVDEVLPSLPSSHSTSRASSVHDSEERYHVKELEDAGTGQKMTHAEKNSLAIETDLEVKSDILDSQQATPTAASFQFEPQDGLPRDWQHAAGQYDHEDLRQVNREHQEEEFQKFKVKIQAHLEDRDPDHGEHMVSQIEQAVFSDSRSLTGKDISSVDRDDKPSDPFVSKRMAIGALVGGAAAIALASSDHSAPIPHEYREKNLPLGDVVAPTQNDSADIKQDFQEPISETKFSMTNKSKKRDWKQNKAGKAPFENLEIAKSTEHTSSVTPVKDDQGFSSGSQQRNDETEVEEGFDSSSWFAPAFSKKSKKDKKNKKQNHSVAMGREMQDHYFGTIDSELLQEESPSLKETEYQKPADTGVAREVAVEPTESLSLGKGNTQQEAVATMAVTALAGAATAITLDSRLEDMTLSTKPPETDQWEGLSNRSKKGKKKKSKKFDVDEIPDQESLIATPSVDKSTRISSINVKAFEEGNYLPTKKNKKSKMEKKDRRMLLGEVESNETAPVHPQEVGLESESQQPQSRSKLQYEDLSRDVIDEPSGTLKEPSQTSFTHEDRPVVLSSLPNKVPLPLDDDLDLLDALPESPELKPEDVDEIQRDFESTHNPSPFHTLALDLPEQVKRSAPKVADSAPIDFESEELASHRNLAQDQLEDMRADATLLARVGPTEEHTGAFGGSTGPQTPESAMSHTPMHQDRSLKTSSHSTPQEPTTKDDINDYFAFPTSTKGRKNKKGRQSLQEMVGISPGSRDESASCPKEVAFPVQGVQEPLLETLLEQQAATAEEQPIKDERTMSIKKKDKKAKKQKASLESSMLTPLYEAGIGDVAGLQDLGVSVGDTSEFDREIPLRHREYHVREPTLEREDGAALASFIPTLAATDTGKEVETMLGSKGLDTSASASQKDTSNATQTTRGITSQRFLDEISRDDEWGGFVTKKNGKKGKKVQASPSTSATREPSTGTATPRMADTMAATDTASEVRSMLARENETVATEASIASEKSRSIRDYQNFQPNYKASPDTIHRATPFSPATTYLALHQTVDEAAHIPLPMDTDEDLIGEDADQLPAQGESKIIHVLYTVPIRDADMPSPEQRERSLPLQAYSLTTHRRLESLEGLPLQSDDSRSEHLSTSQHDFLLDQAIRSSIPEDNAEDFLEFQGVLAPRSVSYETSSREATAPTMSRDEYSVSEPHEMQQVKPLRALLLAEAIQSPLPEDGPDDFFEDHELQQSILQPSGYPPEHVERSILGDESTHGSEQREMQQARPLSDILFEEAVKSRIPEDAPDDFYDHYERPGPVSLPDLQADETEMQKTPSHEPSNYFAGYAGPQETGSGYKIASFEGHSTISKENVESLEEPLFAEQTAKTQTQELEPQGLKRAEICVLPIVGEHSRNVELQNPVESSFDLPTSREDNKKAKKALESERADDVETADLYKLRHEHIEAPIKGSSRDVREAESAKGERMAPEDESFTPTTKSGKNGKKGKKSSAFDWNQESSNAATREPSPLKAADLLETQPEDSAMLPEKVVPKDDADNETDFFSLKKSKKDKKKAKKGRALDFNDASNFVTPEVDPTEQVSMTRDTSKVIDPVEVLAVEADLETVREDIFSLKKSKKNKKNSKKSLAFDYSEDSGAVTPNTEPSKLNDESELANSAVETLEPFSATKEIPVEVQSLEIKAAEVEPEILLEPFSVKKSKKDKKKSKKDFLSNYSEDYGAVTTTIGPFEERTEDKLLEPVNENIGEPKDFVVKPAPADLEFVPEDYFSSAESKKGKQKSKQELPFDYGEDLGAVTPFEGPLDEPVARENLRRDLDIVNKSTPDFRDQETASYVIGKEAVLESNIIFEKSVTEAAIEDHRLGLDPLTAAEETIHEHSDSFIASEALGGEIQPVYEPFEEQVIEPEPIYNMQKPKKERKVKKGQGVDSTKALDFLTPALEPATTATIAAATVYHAVEETKDIEVEPVYSLKKSKKDKRKGKSHTFDSVEHSKPSEAAASKLAPAEDDWAIDEPPRELDLVDTIKRDVEGAEAEPADFESFGSKKSKKEKKRKKRQDFDDFLEPSEPSVATSPALALAEEGLLIGKPQTELDLVNASLRDIKDVETAPAGFAGFDSKKSNKGQSFDDFLEISESSEAMTPALTLAEEGLATDAHQGELNPVDERSQGIESTEVGSAGFGNFGSKKSKVKKKRKEQAFDFTESIESSELVTPALDTAEDNSAIGDPHIELKSMKERSREIEGADPEFADLESFDLKKSKKEKKKKNGQDIDLFEDPNTVAPMLPNVEDHLLEKPIDVGEAEFSLKKQKKDKKKAKKGQAFDWKKQPETALEMIPQAEDDKDVPLELDTEHIISGEREPEYMLMQRDEEPADTSHTNQWLASLMAPPVAEVTSMAVGPKVLGFEDSHQNEVDPEPAEVRHITMEESKPLQLSDVNMETIPSPRQAKDIDREVHGSNFQTGDFYIPGHEDVHQYDTPEVHDEEPSKSFNTTLQEDHIAQDDFAEFKTTKKTKKDKKQRSTSALMTPVPQSLILEGTSSLPRATTTRDSMSFDPLDEPLRTARDVVEIGKKRSFYEDQFSALQKDEFGESGTVLIRKRSKKGKRQQQSPDSENDDAAATVELPTNQVEAREPISALPDIQGEEIDCRHDEETHQRRLENPDHPMLEAHSIRQPHRFALDRSVKDSRAPEETIEARHAPQITDEPPLSRDHDRTRHVDNNDEDDFVYHEDRPAYAPSEHRFTERHTPEETTLPTTAIPLELPVTPETRLPIPSRYSESVIQAAEEKPHFVTSHEDSDGHTRDQQPPGELINIDQPEVYNQKIIDEAAFTTEGSLEPWEEPITRKGKKNKKSKKYIFDQDVGSSSARELSPPPASRNVDTISEAKTKLKHVDPIADKGKARIGQGMEEDGRQRSLDDDQQRSSDDEMGESKSKRSNSFAKPFIKSAAIGAAVSHFEDLQRRNSEAKKNKKKDKKKGKGSRLASLERDNEVEQFSQKGIEVVDLGQPIEIEEEYRERELDEPQHVREPVDPSSVKQGPGVFSVPNWGSQEGPNRDSAVQFQDSPPMHGTIPAHYNVRDSGYQGTEASPVVAEDLDAYETNSQREKRRSVEPYSHEAEDITRTRGSRTAHSTNRSSMTDSSGNPLNIHIEVDPDYEVSVLRPHNERGQEDPQYNHGHDTGRELPPIRHPQQRSRSDSPILSYDERQPSPVNSTTKDRSSVLFQSSPSTREEVDRDRANGSTPSGGHSGELNRDLGASVPLDIMSTSATASMREDQGTVSPGQPRSIFGGPILTNPGMPSLTSPPRTPLSERPMLQTIAEYSPEESPLHKKSREASDIGLPEHSLKHARRSVTPQAFHQHSMRSPLSDGEGRGVHDDVISRLSWPAVDEDAHSVDLDRSKSRNTNSDRRGSGRHSGIPALPTDMLRHHDHDRRSLSGASMRSGESISAIIRDPETQSPGTPPLRRVDRSVSSDLRAANKRSEAKKVAKSAEVDREIEPTIPSSSTYDPVTDKGKGRITKMADVYEAWGDVQGSPRSPTRPPSMRRRQSMQILEMETRLDQLVSENRLLQDAKVRVEKSLNDASHNHSEEITALNSALTTRDLYLKQKDSELSELRTMLEQLQHEVSHLEEVNEGLTGARSQFASEHEQRFGQLQSQHVEVLQQHQESTRELEDLRQQHTSLSSGMEGIVQHEINLALQKKNAELRQMREELEAAKAQVRALQQQILTSRSSDEILISRDEDYFESQCRQLCQHVRQWVLRFSKFSDMKACRLISDVADEKITDRFDNAILDGSDVDVYLSDRIRRRDVFMSVVMTMIWEYIFTRYLFGMDREQRSKLKNLEKTLAEVGPPAAVNKWRATTLALLAKRPAFAEQRAQDSEAVVNEIFSMLDVFLPAPKHLVGQVTDSLRKVVATAVDLAIEMRSQRAEYIMLPPLQPEYDMNGDLARKIYFNAALMNERSGEVASNEELVARQAVVRMVLFPLVVKRGNDDGVGGEEIVVCPAQVLVVQDEREEAGAREGKNKNVRVVSAQGERMEGVAMGGGGNRSVGSFAPSSMDAGAGGMI